MATLADVFGGVNIKDKVKDEATLREALKDIKRFVEDDSKLPVRSMKIRLMRKWICDMVDEGEIRQRSARYDLLNSYHRELFGVDAPYHTGDSCVIERG